MILSQNSQLFLPNNSLLGGEFVRDGRVVDGPESGAVLHPAGLALSQHAAVDPRQVLRLHSERERDAAQQPQCQRPGGLTESRQSWPQSRTILEQSVSNQITKS